MAAHIDDMFSRCVDPAKASNCVEVRFIDNVKVCYSSAMIKMHPHLIIEFSHVLFTGLALIMALAPLPRHPAYYARTSYKPQNMQTLINQSYSCSLKR